MKRAGLLMCLVGPAAGGKTTLAQHLLDTFEGSVAISISVTSRPMRPGEIEGQSYFFVSREEFERRIADGQLFEWEEVHGNLYGTPRTKVEQALREGLDLIFDIDIRGALNLKRRFPSYTAVVFVVPPSSVVLETRLLSRSKVNNDELSRRLETAAGEYEAFMQQAGGDNLIDYFVVNDRLEDSKLAVESILRAERSRVGRIARADLAAICKVEKRHDDAG